MEQLINKLMALPKETEWVEFKVNRYVAQELGEYISALSNSARLHGKTKGYLVFGIEDETHAVAGTSLKPKQVKVGNEELENWLATQLSPRIDFKIHEFFYLGKRIVLFEIDAAQNIPVKFKGTAYVRVGTYKKKLPDFPEKERKIWLKTPERDWSAEICKEAAIFDLDGNAVVRARIEYKKKNPRLSEEVDSWDDETFLNKARITIDGRITNAAIILLGKPEASHHLSPALAQISWILQEDKDTPPKDYEHFTPPFLLNVDRIFEKVRNLKYRYLPDGTLFPIEITQYDPWVIREALHNCIAHQDYSLRGRVNVIEMPDSLIFSNMGSFIPGDIETVIRRNSPPEIYRNPFLAQAMVNLNMIDTIGSGIKKMYQIQKLRYFPMPDYDLSDSRRVEVRIQGKILDPNYTRMLINKTDLDLLTVILLDKVQKRISVSRQEAQYLRNQGLIEGRYPNLYVSSHVASIVGEKARYIKDKGLDDSHYQELVLAFIREYSSATREDIDVLLMDKLPDILSQEQKKNRINRLLSKTMAKENKLIANIGSKRASKWVLVKD